MMLPDNVPATFYIELSELVPFCEGWFCYTKPSKIVSYFKGRKIVRIEKRFKILQIQLLDSTIRY